MKYLILLLLLTGCVKQKCGSVWLNPVHFKIHHSVPNTHHQPIKNAANIINTAISKEMIVIDSDIKYIIDYIFMDGFNVIYIDNLENPSHYAITRIWAWNGIINETDIIVSPNYSLPQFGPGSLETLYLHEFGHALGLKHMSGGVMSEYLNSGLEPKLNKQEIDALKCNY